jgi:hypothetical protein
MDATLEDGVTAVSRMPYMEDFLCNGSGGPAMVKGLWVRTKNDPYILLQFSISNNAR